MDLKLNNNSNLTIPYIPVEYIEMYGQVNIDTGVLVNVTTNNIGRIEAKLQLVQNGVAYTPIYGADNNSSYIQLRLMTGATAGNITSFIINCYTVGTSSQSFSIEENEIVNLIQTYDYYNVNGTNYEATHTTGNKQNKNLKILYTANNNTKVNIWKFKIINSSNVVARDYIPVISLQSGHVGEAALYDKINNTFSYSASTGKFTAHNSILENVNTLFIKDCPNIEDVNILRNLTNLTRVRVDIGTQSGPVSELFKYAAYSGFNDSYENQVKPRLIGTWTISNYWCNNELDTLENAFDGLTIATDDTLNIDSMLENDELSVQTLDSTKPNYNPAAAIILNADGWVHTLQEPAIEGGGLFARPKNLTTSITTLFRGKTTVTDSNGIVTNDTTQTYDFTNFDEFKYFTGITTIAAGTGTAATTVGAFGLCTLLESIEIPEGVTTIGAYAFYNDTALNRIVIPSTLTTTGDYCFSNCTGMADVGKVYYNGTLEQWMNITFNATAAATVTSPMGQGSHFYINGEELTQLTIPAGTTQIKNKTFSGFKYITGTLTIPDTVTSIGTSTFYNCAGLQGDLLLKNVTSIGGNAFRGCNITSFENTASCTYGGGFLQGCGNIKKVILNNSSAVCSPTFYCGTSTNPVEIIIVNNWGGTESSSGSPRTYCKEIVVKGTMSKTFGNYGVYSLEVIRLKNSLVTSNLGICYASNSVIKFIESYGNLTATSNVVVYGNRTNHIAHLGYNAVITALPARFPASKFAKFYVGPGDSKSEDDTILASYIADTNWSTYSTKFATWWDYNGIYKTYKVVDTLTNCTSTNPVDFPFITRKDSYETTIVADEGYTLDSVQVLMYECADDTATPATPTDITNDVYDANTGTISIEHVIGNVEIIASAI